MTAVAETVGLWALCAAIGWGTSALIFPHAWRRDRAMLAPVVGAAVLILLSSGASYAGAPMRSAAPGIALVALALSLAGVLLDRRPMSRADFGRAALVHAVGGVGASSVLAGLLIYHAWNPYTDTFTYISIADVLQTHGFFTPAPLDPTEPVLSQMWWYQTYGYRMGSNFLLAFATALFRADYSFDVYLPVLTVGVWLGVAAFWAVCRRGLLMTRRAAAVAVVLYSFHTGVPITNALWGFMPQTWGTVFLLTFFAMWSRAPGRSTPRYALATGMIGGTLLLTYTELVPFALAGAGAVFLGRIVSGHTLASHARRAMAAIVVAAGVAPVAAMRMLTVLREQSAAVVGWDVHFTKIDYVGMLAGYRSLSQNVIAAHTATGWVVVAASFVALSTAAGAVLAAPRRTVLRAALVGAGFLVAAVWFGFVAMSPWNPGQSGHPWSTFKVATYGCFLFVALWGTGIARMWQNGGALKVAAAAQLTVFLAFFPFSVHVNARGMARAMQQFTGRVDDPIAEYKRLPALVAGEPPGSPINLIIPTAAGKHRQLVAYFLRRPVLADWREDVHVKLPAREPFPDARFPALVYDPSSPSRTVANLVWVAAPPIRLPK